MNDRNRTSVASPMPPQDLSSLVGWRFIYTYANGWRYELYAKNATTIDYRIHSGHVGGRWVKHQKVDTVALTEGVFKISWNEPTGTSVVVTIVPGERVIHGTIFFPQWIRQHGHRTVVYQNDHLGDMQAYRDAGPTYPIYVVAEFGRITLAEFMGVDNEEAIACPPSELPAGWGDRTN